MTLAPEGEMVKANSARPHRMRLSLDSGLSDPNTMSAQDLIERLIRRPVQR
ncbi:MAG: hypothetical protein QOG23_2445 [Blastocatellia bacterium]|jgi:hypothetical protein|nr:hypothetical protein [Blastocatellia bacterium]